MLDNDKEGMGMKLFTKKEKKKETKKEKNLVIKNGKDDVRIYPKKTLLVTKLEHEN